MKIINKLIASALFTLVMKMPVVFATTWPAVFVSIDPALLFTNPGITQEINLYNGIGNTYIDQTKGIQSSTVSLGIGIRSYQSEQLQVNTSWRYVPVPSLPLQGQIWQLKSPLFNDLAYSFKVKSNLLLVDNIISWTRHRLQPGVILGLGMSTNTTGGYHEIPLTDSAAPSLQVVNGARTAQIAYELGAVLDYSMDRAVIELAYRYVNAGTGYLQPSQLQNTMDRLSTGQLNYRLVSIGIRAYYEL